MPLSRRSQVLIPQRAQLIVEAREGARRQDALRGRVVAQHDGPDQLLLLGVKEAVSLSCEAAKGVCLSVHVVGGFGGRKIRRQGIGRQGSLVSRSVDGGEKLGDFWDWGGAG